jgi:leader peptidase (prepilin peptidase)/N-methyltransferase
MPAQALWIGVVLTFLLGGACAWAVPRLSAERTPALGAAPIFALQAILVFWALAAAKGAGVAAASIALSSALLTLAVVDVTAFRLPDLITLPLILAGLVLAWLEQRDFAAHVLGAAAGWAAVAGLAGGFRALTGRRGIGMGDAKLLAAAGAWCGWQALPATVLVACVLAFAWVAIRLARQGRASLAAPLPFGAPLACAFWLVRLHGPIL